MAQRIELRLIQRRVLEGLTGFIRSRIRALFGERVSDVALHVIEARIDDIDRGAGRHPAAISGLLAYGVRPFPQPHGSAARARSLPAHGVGGPALARAAAPPGRRVARPAGHLRGHPAARPRPRRRQSDPQRALARPSSTSRPGPTCAPCWCRGWPCRARGSSGAASAAMPCTSSPPARSRCSGPATRWSASAPATSSARWR